MGRPGESGSPGFAGEPGLKGARGEDGEQVSHILFTGQLTPHFEN